MLQMAVLAIQDTKVRTEELVGGAAEKVTIPGLHVDALVRGKMNSVHIEQRPDPVHGIGDARDIDQGASRIGSRRHRDQPGLGAQQAEQMPVVEPAVRHIHPHLMHHNTAISRRLLPARHIGVVIQPADDDFVPRLPLT